MAGKGKKKKSKARAGRGRSRTATSSNPFAWGNARPQSGEFPRLRAVTVDADTVAAEIARCVADHRVREWTALVFVQWAALGLEGSSGRGRASTMAEEILRRPSSPRLQSRLERLRKARRAAEEAGQWDSGMAPPTLPDGEAAEPAWTEEDAADVASEGRAFLAQLVLDQLPASRRALEAVGPLVGSTMLERLWRALVRNFDRLVMLSMLETDFERIFDILPLVSRLAPAGAAQPLFRLSPTAIEQVFTYVWNYLPDPLQLFEHVGALAPMAALGDDSLRPAFLSEMIAQSPLPSALLYMLDYKHCCPAAFIDTPFEPLMALDESLSAGLTALAGPDETVAQEMQRALESGDLEYLEDVTLDLTRKYCDGMLVGFETMLVVFCRIAMRGYKQQHGFPVAEIPEDGEILWDALMASEMRELELEAAGSGSKPPAVKADDLQFEGSSAQGDQGDQDDQDDQDQEEDDLDDPIKLAGALNATYQHVMALYDAAKPDPSNVLLPGVWARQQPPPEGPALEKPRGTVNYDTDLDTAPRDELVDRIRIMQWRVDSLERRVAVLERQRHVAVQGVQTLGVLVEQMLPT